MAIKYDKIRKYLEDDRERLLAELERSAGEASSNRQNSEGSPFGKREEEAEVTYEVGRRAVLETHLKSQLLEVEEALQNLDNQTYGLCTKCGKPIDPARLEALPQATLCLACKNKKIK
jgi:DnaK suppressor protein